MPLVAGRGRGLSFSQIFDVVDDVLSRHNFHVDQTPVLLWNHTQMASKAHARILRAAESLFAECGFHGASTRDISKAADVHESSLFRLFGTKEALFDEVFEVVLERMMDPKQSVIAFGLSGWKPPVLDFAIRMQSTWDSPGGRLFLFALLERQENYLKIAARWRAALFPIMQRIQELQASGYLREGNPSRMTEAIGDAIYVWYLLPQISVDVRKSAGLPTKQSGRLLEMLLDGMRAKKRSEHSLVFASD